MELLQILQLCSMLIVFMLTLLFVLLPLKLMPSDPQMPCSRGTRRLLDLCHSFSAGVFIGTCFVQLLPHAEETMKEAFSVGGLPMTYSAVVTQLSSMLGFFVVLLVDRAIDSCCGGRTTVCGGDAHELTTVRDYATAVSSSDDSGDSDAELVREKESMLHLSEISDELSKDQAHRTKKRRSTRVGKRKAANGSAAAAEIASATPLSHVHSVVGHDELHIRSIVLLLALSLHSLFEGVAIGLQNTIMQLIGLSVGITVHGCLIAFALGMALASQLGSSQSTIIRFGAVYSAMVPGGIGIGMAVGTVRGFVGRLISGLLQSLTAGTFIYVIFVEIFPSEIDRSHHRLLKVLVMFIGFIIISCLRFVSTVFY